MLMCDDCSLCIGKRYFRAPISIAVSRLAIHDTSRSGSYPRAPATSSGSVTTSAATAASFVARAAATATSIAWVIGRMPTSFVTPASWHAIQMTSISARTIIASIATVWFSSVSTATNSWVGL